MYATKPEDFMIDFKKDTKFYRYPVKRMKLDHFRHHYKVEIHINGKLSFRIYGDTAKQAEKRADNISAYLKLLKRKAQLDEN